jgi:hypothetical protein
MPKGKGQLELSTARPHWQVVGQKASTVLNLGRSDHASSLRTFKLICMGGGDIDGYMHNMSIICVYVFPTAIND